MFTADEGEELVRIYLGPLGAGEPVFCPSCDEELEIHSGASSGLGMQVEIKCRGCRREYTWSQPQPSRVWKQLHLDYFVERRSQQQVPRCPYDDCYISSGEYSDGTVQFLCPFCNRRGAVRLDTP